MGWQAALGHDGPVWHNLKGELSGRDGAFDSINDIRYAWSLVEEMERQGFAFQLYSPNPQDEESDCWSAVFTRWVPQAVGHRVAFTASRAITIAAVEAVGKEKDDR